MSSASEFETDETALEVLDAALRAFGASGFRATSLSEVAVAAGVSRPTLYARYPDKVHLFRAVIERAYDEAIQAVLRTVEAGGPFEEVLIQVLYDYYGRLFDRFHGLAQIDELTLAQSEQAADLVADARVRMQAVLTRLLRGYDQDGEIAVSAVGVPVTQLVNLLRSAPLYLKNSDTTRTQYRQALKSLARVVASALIVETGSTKRRQR